MVSDFAAAGFTAAVFAVSTLAAGATVFVAGATFFVVSVFAAAGFTAAVFAVSTLTAGATVFVAGTTFFVVSDFATVVAGFRVVVFAVVSTIPGSGMTFKSSTSKIRRAFGGITGEAPSVPYPKELGIQALTFIPSFIKESISCHP